MHMSYNTTYTWKRRNSFKGSMMRDFIGTYVEHPKIFTNPAHRLIRLYM